MLYIARLATWCMCVCQATLLESFFCLHSTLRQCYCLSITLQANVVPQNGTSSTPISVSTTGPVTSLLVTGLRGNTGYTARVFAVNGAGDGFASGPMDFTTEYSVVQPTFNQRIITTNIDDRLYSFTISPFSDVNGPLRCVFVFVHFPGDC